MKMASLSLLLTLSLLTRIASAAPVKYSDLLKEEAFANGTPEQRLDIVNQKIVSKAIQSYDINADVMGRMVLEYLQPEQEPAARMNQYGEMRKKFAALPATYDVETHLVVEFLAATPEGQKNDLVGMMRHIFTLQDQKIICWPVVAPLHTGMLAAHLASNADYQKMTPKDKAIYLRRLSTEGVVGDMTATHFDNGVVAKHMAATPLEQRKATFQEFSPLLDFFTKSSIQHGFEQ